VLARTFAARVEIDAERLQNALLHRMRSPSRSTDFEPS